MTHWHYAMLEHIPEDAIVRPMIGEEPNLTREQAHGMVQEMLDQFAPRGATVAQMAEEWRVGAKDDTVYHNQFILTIYECDGRCNAAYLAAVEPIVAAMRQAGVEVTLAELPGA